MKPTKKPANPCFSSGPCAKRPGWSLATLDTSSLGRSHRAKLGKARLEEVITRSKKVLGMPANYLLGIVPASDTGAIEMAMWSLLGARGVDVLAWESFGSTWASDCKNQLKLADLNVYKAEYGQIPDLSRVNWDRDVVFTWNGTTSGVRVPNGDWIKADRKGLAICDATSAVFAMNLPWEKLDVVTWSWQKVLGGEGAHGMIALSPHAVERLQTYTPSWPMPKIFQMTKKGQLIEGIFKGETINTPSMLCVEDALDGLKWAEYRRPREALRRQSESTGSMGGKDAMDRLSCRRRQNALLHLHLPQDHRPVVRIAFRRCESGSRQKDRLRIGKRRRGLRHRRLQRRASGPAHLGRRHGRNVRHRSAYRLAGVGVGGSESGDGESRLIISCPLPLPISTR
jgi:phosphoserine aminotransferase